MKIKKFRSKKRFNLKTKTNRRKWNNKRKVTNKRNRTFRKRNKSKKLKKGGAFLYTAAKNVYTNYLSGKLNDIYSNMTLENMKFFSYKLIDHSIRTNCKPYKSDSAFYLISPFIIMGHLITFFLFNSLYASLSVKKLLPILLSIPEEIGNLQTIFHKLIHNKINIKNLNLPSSAENLLLNCITKSTLQNMVDSDNPDFKSKSQRFLLDKIWKKVMGNIPVDRSELVGETIGSRLKDKIKAGMYNFIELFPSFDESGSIKKYADTIEVKEFQFWETIQVLWEELNDRYNSKELFEIIRNLFKFSNSDKNNSIDSFYEDSYLKYIVDKFYTKEEFKEILNNFIGSIDSILNWIMLIIFNTLSLSFNISASKGNQSPVDIFINGLPDFLKNHFSSTLQLNILHTIFNKIKKIIYTTLKIPEEKWETTNFFSTITDYAMWLYKTYSNPESAISCFFSQILYECWEYIYYLFSYTIDFTTETIKANKNTPIISQISDFYDMNKYLASISSEKIKKIFFQNNILKTLEIVNNSEKQDGKSESDISNINQAKDKLNKQIENFKINDFTTSYTNPAILRNSLNYTSYTPIGLDSGLGNYTSGLGNYTSGLGNYTSGLGNTTSGLGNYTSGLGNTTSGFGNTTSDLGNTTSGLNANWMSNYPGVSFPDNVTSVPNNTTTTDKPVLNWLNSENWAKSK